jgi:hypothetical protein
MHLEDGVDGEAGDALDPGNGEAGELAIVEHAAHRLHQLRHLYQPVPACLQSSSDCGLVLPVESSGRYAY